MLEDAFGAFISNLGLFLQAVGTLMVLVLFQLLRGQAARRNYFLAWSDGWIALGIALSVLWVARGHPLEQVWWVGPAYFVYLAGKFVFFGLLLSGAFMYSHGYDRRLRWPVLLAVSLAAAVFVFQFDHHLDRLVVWQTPVAVLTCAASSWLLLTIAPERRTLGSRATGVVFLGVAAVWTLYFIAFRTQAPLTLQLELEFSAVLAAYNSFIDLLLQTLLAFGMVLILLEDAKREIDAAHAELGVAHDKLLVESYRDSLTGVFNRRAFGEGVGLETARTTYGAVVMLDLDNLKQVNDAHGHAAGDDLIRHLVAELRNNLRPSDMLYRMGGDEFLVVLPQARAEATGPRLDLLLQQAPRLRAGDAERGLRLKVSLGAADYASAADLPEAIREADRRMYEVKRRHKATGELDTDPRGGPNALSEGQPG